MKTLSICVALTLAAAGGAARAQQAATPADPQAKQSSAEPAPLVVFFDKASDRLRPQDAATLDKASRAYAEGKPVVMILTGSSDRVGGAILNLKLSQRRATAVLDGLLARGIPAERFQVLAKGETDLHNPTKPGVSDAQNRRVEITWR